jgi:hypothetical protein
MENKMIRFIDSRYNELFKIPDGGNVVLTSFNGEKATCTCHYMGDCHVMIGNNVYHICQFAEIMERNGTVIAPEIIKEGNICDTYEVYQIRDVRNTDYCFRSFEEAGKHFNRADYIQMYAGMLAPKTTLEDLYVKHNRDNRPFGKTMHSLSVSDVVVLNRNGESTAYYVDTFGFTDVSKLFNQALTADRDIKTRKPKETER